MLAFPSLRGLAGGFFLEGRQSVARTGSVRRRGPSSTIHRGCSRGFQLSDTCARRASNDNDSARVHGPFERMTSPAEPTRSAGDSIWKREHRLGNEDNGVSLDVSLADRQARCFHDTCGRPTAPRRGFGFRNRDVPRPPPLCAPLVRAPHGPRVGSTAGTSGVPTNLPSSALLRAPASAVPATFGPPTGIGRPDCACRARTSRTCPTKCS